MANVFTGDPHVKALWRFEPAALTVDSIGSNTLSLKNTPVVDQTNVKEGSGCALIAQASNQGLYINDSSLNAGFPFKTGDTTKKISFCGWFRPSTAQGADIFGKWSNDLSNDSFVLIQNLTSFTVGTCYSGIHQWDQYVGVVANNTWYHVALVIDGVAKTWKLRVWNGSVSSNYTGTAGGMLTVGSSQFILGNGNWANTAIDGRLDEIVVFDRLLSDSEIDSIRSGSYSPPAQIFPDSCKSVTLSATGQILGLLVATVCRSLTTCATPGILGEIQPDACRSLSYSAIPVLMGLVQPNSCKSSTICAVGVVKSVIGPGNFILVL